MDGTTIIQAAIGIVGILQGYQIFIAKTNQKYFETNINNIKERLNDITKRLERLENLAMLNSKFREK